MRAKIVRIPAGQKKAGLEIPGGGGREIGGRREACLRGVHGSHSFPSLLALSGAMMGLEGSGREREGRKEGRKTL